MSKDKRWIVPNPNDPGILRKKADTETDLFAFGYACKIFRDDQKALEMDQGKHLIPWMGDETLKIDRYDARGHLSEISQFEATNQDYVLTPEERRIEQLCDEERYRALHHNEEEQEMYQEEELKRLKQALSSDKEYGQVAYQYEADGAPPSTSEPDVNTEDGEPFVPSPAMYIPANIRLPSTVKENQIIEKTAAHIASHGPQVEILIKTRQANNQKLNFLHVGSPLNVYYNYILTQIKTGRYKPGFITQQEAESNQDNEHYLHPSLAPAATSTAVESAPSIPSIAYKPSSDCSYNMLVNKIRNMQQSQVKREGEEEPSTSEDSPPSRRKRRKRLSTQSSTVAMKQVAIPPQHVKEIIARLINFAHSRDLHPSEIAGNLLKQDSKNLGFVEPGHKYHDYYLQQLRETYKENIYNLSNPSMKAADNDDLNSFDVLSSYDPERPTEEDLDHSPSENGDSPLLKRSSEAVLPSQENNELNNLSPSEYDVPNQPPSKPAPVCFSIKKPKEAERLEHASAFPLEETSSDEEGKQLTLLSSETDKEKSSEGDRLQSLTLTKNPSTVGDDAMKTPKSMKQSPGSPHSVITCITISSSQSAVPGLLNRIHPPSRLRQIEEQGHQRTDRAFPCQASSEGDRKSFISSDSWRTSTTISTENSRKSTYTDSSRKSTSTDSSRKSTSTDSSRKTTSTDNSKKSSTSTDISKKSSTTASSDSSKKSSTSISADNSKKCFTSTDSSKKCSASADSSKKSSTSTEGSKKSTTLLENTKKRTASTDNSRKRTTSSDSSRKSLTLSDSTKRNTSAESSRTRIASNESRQKDKRSHRKHKSPNYSSPDKYIRRERERNKLLAEKNYREPVVKVRSESDDFPPFPEDHIPCLLVPEENLEKKREERKKKVKEMIEKIKTESLGIREENSQTTVQISSTLSSPTIDLAINSIKTFLPHGPTLVSPKTDNKTEENKTEEQLRVQVKQSLKKLVETSLAAIPPVNEEDNSCSQLELSSAANSTGFETPTSCGRPRYRVSRTPSVGLTESALQGHSSSVSSSTETSLKTHKKKKHHKKRKKRKGRSKVKKHHESSSDDSSSDEESSDPWVSSSDSDPRPKKRHKKSSKRSHKRRKRKHRRRHSSSSYSSSD